MSTQISSSNTTRSSVNLVRSSHSWTEAESAAGFVLRYLAPMRRQLTTVLGSSNEADQALKILLTHLVSAGFGEHRKGRLRDFLARAVRSSAKARLTEQGRWESEKEKLACLAADSKEWVVMWRDCLLERAWRALERMEHQDASRPLYSVLWSSTVNSKASLDELAAAVEKQCSVKLDQVKLQQLKLEAKAAFAQLLADEVVETLENPDKASVKKEIQSLGIGGVFSGLTV
ncbi:MAG: hypothetical protein KDB00_01400 [Planctomycetales bacterium]|nr:hypothetical protein [Planctomycetales bacterium]